MWNSFNTGDYSGMIAETKKIRSKDGQEITVYHSRPLTDGVHPGIVLIPHMPGWDEWCRETARRFTEHGYSVVCPDIYSRFGTGTPSEVANRRRENGLAPDKTVMADTAASIEFLRDRHDSNGKVGVIGMCSG
ncbi:MAG: dienelactone hydrolase family protein, partial [Erysipelotrichaceae bacterium]|nr:dienelactone hydrolase family protein [Erysipelotrichaceae bacterium]